jgi:hypothetical protein
MPRRPRVDAVLREPLRRHPEPAEQLAMDFLDRWLHLDLEGRVLALARCRDHARDCDRQAAMNAALVDLCVQLVDGLAEKEPAP